MDVKRHLTWSVGYWRIVEHMDLNKVWKKLLVGGLVVAVLFGALGFVVGAMWSKLKTLGQAPQPQAQQQQAAAPAAPKVDIKTIKDLWEKNVIKFGDAKKNNLLVEVADPSCPYCHVAAGLNPELSGQIGPQFKLVADGGTYVAPVPEMKKLVDSGKAAFVWIYTPGHGNGEMGTKALYCAFDAGKFWEAHDRLMTNKGYELLNNTIKNDKTKSQELVDFLGMQNLKDCLDSGKYDSRLAEDIKLASSLGVSGTPGFFVNETNFAGAYSWNDMKSALK